MGWVAIQFAKAISLPWGKWLRWLFGHPAVLGCVLLALWGVYQRHEHLKAVKLLDACNARYEAALKASGANAKAQADAKAAKEAEYKAKAEKADDHYQTALADADDRVAAYIAAHRVRTGPAHISTTPASAQGDRAEIPAIAPTDAVAVSEADVKVCAADYAYSKAAYDWAQTLVAP